MSDKTKFLNLDEVAAPQKTVKIAGNEYQVIDMTVENFIETTRLSQSGIEVTADVQFEQAVKMLSRYIPDAPEAVLRGLTFQKLEVLMKFVTGELEAEQKAKEQVEATGTTGEEASKK
jgi:hypothetical protein